MRKTNLVLVIALMLTVLTGLTLSQVNGVSAQGDAPVGVVVAYTPGVSITIVDQKGNQSEFALDPAVKIQPSGKGDSIKVGSFVTIIAPASLDKGKQKAVGIVVHPDVPKGWKVLDGSATPLTKQPPSGTETATPTGTLATETAAVTATATPMLSETVTPTETGMPKSPADAKSDGTTAKADTFIEWLRSLFQQVLSR